VVVEDSLFGVKAAKAAGMGCVAVTTGAYGKNELDAENPDLIVATLKSPEVLEFILS
jgi:beta-phosphoglucomutase-like phosphatase (HAD superfamily)